MTDALISVVIPTYNRAPLVAECIGSVLAQKEVAVEVIVVDDCSTDNTDEVLATFGDTIKVVKTQVNSERGASRNLGASAASGELLAFVDSDDLWEPDKLKSQLPHALKGPTVSGISFIDAAGRPVGRNHMPTSKARRRLLLENLYLATPSTIVLPRALFKEVGGFPEEKEVQGSEDWLFLIKLVYQARLDIAVVPRALVRYRVHEGNSTAAIESVARCMWSATQWLETQEIIGAAHLRRMRGYTAGVIGRQFAARGRWREALAWVRKSRREASVLLGLRAMGGVFISGSYGVYKRAFR